MSEAASTSTLAQRRARNAWEASRQLLSGPNADDTAREAKRLPTMILTSGLGQALAFVEAKKGTRCPLLTALNEWMAIREPGGKGITLLERIIEGNSAFLRRATDECLEYLQWLNRFLEAAGKGQAE